MNKKSKKNKKKKNSLLYYSVYPSTLVYKFFKYLFNGIVWPFLLFYMLISNIDTNKSIDVEKLKKQSRLVYEKDRKKELKRKKKVNKDVVSDEGNYLNKNLKVKKKTLSESIKEMLNPILSLPVLMKKRFDNITLIKQARNKKKFDTQTLLVDFSLEDDNNENKGKRVTWEYVAINEKGKKVKGYFDAYSRLDVQSFLMGEGLAVYSIRTSKLIQKLYGKMGSNKTKIKAKDLIFLLTQLSTYLKSGITLVDSLNILVRQVQKKAYKKILRDLTYDLTTGESLSAAMEKRGPAFPKLLINMIKASELTGELPEALDDMVEYYTEAEEARKQMISALTYPSIVFIFTLAVVTFVMIYVVPKFVTIYETMDASEIPAFTKAVISVSTFLQNNFIYIILVIVLVILLFSYIYKKSTIFKTAIQVILMHIPVIKNVIIYNEVTMFAKTFSSLLSHNVSIIQSMDILNGVTNNEIYKGLILDTVNNLAVGDKISKAFKDQWAFPIPAYEMIVTGEKTGQLSEMMNRVSTYYQSLHKNTVTRIKALVEPILIVFLTFSVGVILLAVIIPMFNMYQQVQSLG